MFGLVGVYYMGLGSSDCSAGGRKAFRLFVVLLFLVWLVFCNNFGSLWETLTLCRWGGKYVLFCVCCVLGVYVVVLVMFCYLVVVVELWLAFSILVQVLSYVVENLFLCC